MQSFIVSDIYVYEEISRRRMLSILAVSKVRSHFENKKEGERDRESCKRRTADIGVGERSGTEKGVEQYGLLLTCTCCSTPFSVPKQQVLYVCRPSLATLSLSSIIQYTDI
jgi:hypothetical protein